METYIALLLLIVPGFIARNISKYLTKNSKEAFEIDSIIMSLIYSVFIMLLNFLCLFFRYGISDIVEFTKMFSSMRFVIKYAIVTLVNSFYVAVFWTLCSSIFIDAINQIRKNTGRRKLSKSNSFFDSLASDNYDHLLRIDKNGSISRGVLSHLERDDSGKIIGVVLNHTKELEDKIEEKGENKFPIKQTYVDLGSNLHISEYNSDKFRKPKTNYKKDRGLLFAEGLLSFLIIHGIIIVVSVWII